MTKCRLFGKGDRLYIQAHQIWTILVAQAMMKEEKLTYGDLAKLMKRSSQVGVTLGRQLGIVGNYCVEHNLPPLNIIVVNQETRMPGHDAVVRPGKTVQEEIDAVFRRDWFGIRMPSPGTFRAVWDVMRAGL